MKRIFYENFKWKNFCNIINFMYNFFEIVLLFIIVDITQFFFFVVV